MSTLRQLTEQIIKEAEDKAQVDALSQAMGDGFGIMGSELKSKEDELKADVEQADVKVTEAFGAIAVIGVILAAPKVVELIVKGFSKVVSVYKKLFKPKSASTPQEQADMAKKIVDFTHKWHKKYIQGVKWILKVTGLFRKAGITEESQQQKAAELVFYTIIAGLAVYSGIGAASAFKGVLSSGSGGEFALGSFEAAMAGIKSQEVAEFLTKLGLKVTGA